MAPKKVKRVSIKPKKCPNPLFVKWLKEWIDEAVSRNLNVRFGYRKALKSLQSYPLVLRSGKDCGVLQDFGPKLCARLDRKLSEHEVAHPEGVKVQPQPKIAAISTFDVKVKTPPKNTRIKATKYQEPTLTSTLFTDSDIGLPSNEFQLNDYTSCLKLSSISPSKKTCDNLPIDNKVKYSLPSVENPSTSDLQGTISLENRRGAVSLPRTTKRLKTGKRIAASVSVFPSTHVVDSSPVDKAHNSDTCTLSTQSLLSKKNNTNIDNNSSIKDVILQPGSFEIILVVDNAELFGNAKAKESATRATLTSLNVTFHVRSLKVGDFTWIAQDSTNGHELVLPYIIERKRIDDLAGSIKDGRYREQKFRLKQSGIQNKIYLIENMGKAEKHLGLPVATLSQASVNTQIHGGFSVKHTSSHLDSMRYLATLTRTITRTYKTKILVRCLKENLAECDINDDLVSLMDFEEFNQSAKKIRKWRVQEMFIKHLVQLRGLSVEKAVAIVEKYPTPRSLMDAYAEGNGEMLLAKIPFGTQARKIGPVISAAVHKLYTLEKLT